jgi:predicted ATP-grasp superfamily ATP-dependent carboligase
VSDLLILGASARAAAQSARRAGLTPHAVDLFNDRDLLAVAECRRCELANYPDGLESLAAEFGPMPWMYTGGLENHPELVGRIAANRELIGNGPEQLRSVRGEAAWREIIDNGYWTPNTLLDGLAPPGKLWVWKSFASSGGLGVRWAEAPDIPPETYLQEFFPGITYSAVLIPRIGTLTLIGVTEQLVGCDWLNADAFLYAGSIGPVVSKEEFRDLLMMGQSSPTTLIAEVELSGVTGIDVLDDDGTPLLFDINPRYPASAEVLELATGVCVLDGVKRSPGLGGVVGKAVYYAQHDFRFPEYAPFDRAVAVAADPWALPDFADLPAAGTMMAAGQPVLTLFAHAADRDSCLLLLQARAVELDALFGHTP